MIINGHKITQDSPTYVIAEIGNNHGGSLTKCKELFHIAKLCGADAVKLQKRDNRALYTKAFYNMPYINENSYGATYGEHREALEFNVAQYLELREYAQEIGIDFFATAFDANSALFLRAIDMPAFKIASGDLTTDPLLKQIADYRKPMIVSTGGASYNEIDNTYGLLFWKRSEFALLYCVASYPNRTEQLDLKCIPSMIERYPKAIIGFSSHHPAIWPCLVASALGARIIEVHFTDNRANKGTDHAFSLEPTALEKLCHDLKAVCSTLRDGEKRVLPEEKEPIRKMGKAWHFTKPLLHDHELSPEDVSLKSPADGMPPYTDVIGKKLILSVSTSDNLTEDLIK